MTPEQLIKRRERRRRKFRRECALLAELILSVMVACSGEQHNIPGLVVVGFALMGIVGCRLWANR